GAGRAPAADQDHAAGMLAEEYRKHSERPVLALLRDGCGGAAARRACVRHWGEAGRARPADTRAERGLGGQHLGAVRAAPAGNVRVVRGQPRRIAVCELLGEAMTELCDLCVKYGTDKVTWGYTPHYFERFADKRDKVRRVLEIGICGYRDIPNNVVGASLF